MQSIPLNLLVPSKLNVRKVAPTGIEALAENIHLNGLLQNLTVTKGEGDTYEVVAGSRRHAALKHLVKTKRLPEDAPVACEEVSAEKALEISLSENAMREAMHPADQFEAFKALTEQGEGVEAIAARYGVTPAIVQQRMKLAKVSTKLIKEYRKNKISLDVLMAFTMTDDHKRQEEIYDGMNEWSRANGARQVKATLTTDTVPSSDKLAKFVGLKAYEKAGGEVRRDLFANGDDTGFLTDPALLRKLADDQLQAAVAKELKAGWKWGEIIVDDFYKATSAYGQIAPTHTLEQTARMNEITDRLQQIELEASNATDETALQDEQEKLEAEYEKISDAASFTDEDKARLGVLITIDYDGKPRISRGRLTPDEVKAERKAAKGLNGAGQGAAEPSEATGHSAALIESLTAHKTAAMQAKLAASPHIGLAATVHALLQSLSPGRFTTSVVKVTGRVPHLNGTGEEIADSLAVKELAKREKAVLKGLPDEEEKRLPWLITQSDKRLIDILAVCAAKTIDVIERKHGEQPNRETSQQLCDALSVDMADYWEPTADGYFARVSKSVTEAAVREAVGSDGIVLIAGCKKAEMCKRAETAVQGKRWLPELLR